MKKPIIYLIVAAAAVVIVAALLFFYGGKNEAGAPTVEDQAMSMRELLARGGSQTCTFESSQDSTDSSGTVYISDGRMRGNFETRTASGQRFLSHMIVENDIAYVWSDQAEQGMKLDFSAINEVDEENQDRQAVDSTGFDPDSRVNYDCVRSSPDQSLFNPPSGVSFVDLAATMRGMMGNSEDGAAADIEAGAGAAQCAQCNLIADPNARMQCVAALGCN